MRITRHFAFRFFFVAAVGIVSPRAAFSQQQPAGRGSSPAPISVLAQPTITRDGQNTIVRVEANGPLSFYPLLLANPERLVLDLPGTRLNSGTLVVPSHLSPVREVRVGQFKPDAARVVIDLNELVPYQIRTQQDSVTVELAPSPSAGSGRTDAGIALARANVKSRLRNETKMREQPTTASETVRRAGVSEPQFTNGMLTLHASGQTLRNVLKQIGDRSGIEMNLAGGLGDEQITVDFERSRVDEALRQMLKQYSVFFFYAAEPAMDNTPALKRVWVFPTGQGLPTVAFAAQNSTLTPEVPKPPDAGSSRAAKEAPETSSQAGGSEAIGKLMAELRDPHPELRLQAISQALSSGVAIPQSTLIELALRDDEPGVRLLALHSLPVDPGLRWVDEQALTDSSRSVSQLAADRLRRLDTSERARYWTTQSPPASSP